MEQDELTEKSDMLEKIKNMKVTDLKRMLKACSLPINGNKPDLVERLTEAYISGKGSEIFAAELVPELNKTESNLHAGNEADFAAELEGKVPELNETESNEACIRDKNNIDLISSSSFGQVSANSEEDSNLNGNSQIAKPLKKRAVTNDNEDKVVKKKMRINRNTTSINFDFFNPSPVNPIKSTDLTVKTATDSLEATTKDIPNAEKQVERHSRIVFSAFEKPAIRSGVAKLHTSAASTSLTDLERLKRRAERFGESVSSVLKEMEEKEKLERRRSKFAVGGPLAVTSRMSDEEKKRKRAERFGLS